MVDQWFSTEQIQTTVYKLKKKKKKENFHIHPNNEVSIAVEPGLRRPQLSNSIGAGA